MSTPKRFVEIDQNFKSNICTLQVFSQRIGDFADEHDKTVVDQFVQTLANLFEIDLDELRQMADQEDELAYKETPAGNIDILPTEVHLQLDEDSRDHFESALVSLSQKDPEKFIQLLRVIKSLQKSLPIQGYILRRSALVTLMSYFEALLSDLIQGFYLRYPAALPAENRTLSLVNLREIGSIDEAERYLAVREAESVLRGSLMEQLDYFGKRFKMDLSPLDAYLDTLTEISQRRNLIVHNNGVVNRTYLSKVPQEYIEEHQIKEGRGLGVSGDYLASAIDHIHLCGVFLIQQGWRKWEKESCPRANTALIEHVYDSLCEEQYDLTKNLAMFVGVLDAVSDGAARIVIINHAIALKTLGEIEEMEHLLLGHDWSACSLRFTTALHALRNEEELLIELLPKAIAAGHINRYALQEWPLFKDFRTESWFAEVMESYELQAVLPNHRMVCPEAVNG